MENLKTNQEKVREKTIRERGGKKLKGRREFKRWVEKLKRKRHQLEEDR